MNLVSNSSVIYDLSLIINYICRVQNTVFLFKSSLFNWNERDSFIKIELKRFISFNYITEIRKPLCFHFV